MVSAQSLVISAIFARVQLEENAETAVLKSVSACFIGMNVALILCDEDDGERRKCSFR
jgi:hypothetical protein